MDSHSSRRFVTKSLMQPTRTLCESHNQVPIWSCSRRGLPYHLCCHKRGALLPHRFTLTCFGQSQYKRSILCCTFRRLTPPRDYLAPYSMEPGLSSPNVYGYTPKATVWPTRYSLYLFR